MLGKWERHDKSYKVNLYYMAKMFDSNIQSIEEMLKKSYIIECSSKYSKTNKLTFIEYVNAKRQFTASVLGLEEYF